MSKQKSAKGQLLMEFKEALKDLLPLKKRLDELSEEDQDWVNQNMKEYLKQFEGFGEEDDDE